MGDNINELWGNVLKILETELSKPSFETWLKSTTPINLHDKTLIIQVPHELAKDWLETRYSSIIRRALAAVAEEELNIKFITHADAKMDPTPEEDHDLVQPYYESSQSYKALLNPKYTFDTFVVGSSNRFAHAAALAVAEAPGKAYNPLFIYGGVGLGKTHLMQAIGHFVLSHSPSMKVVYVSSEKFTNEIINAIRYDKTVAFRNKYRSVDVLLIDDIQFLAGKESTQEEFFHTFNALYEAGKQIVISSDRPPKEIPTLEDRLRSRFEWGLTTDIQAPDLETRIAILKKKANSDGLNVPHDVLVYIANQVNSNIRELEGALIRVIAYSSLVDKEITISLASEVLKDILPSGKQRQISIELIQQAVSEHFNINPDDLRAKSRARNVTYPRQIAMYLSRELTDSSLLKIGEEFGGRDHTTVIHACEKIIKDQKDDPGLASEIKEIIEQLKNR